MTDVTADMAQETMTLLDLFLLGKWAMWPLLIFSIGTLSLLVERTIFLLTNNLKIAETTDMVLTSINEHRVEEAAVRCSSHLPCLVSTELLENYILGPLDPETEQKLVRSLYENNPNGTGLQLKADPDKSDIIDALKVLRAHKIIAEENELAADVINEGLTMIHLDVDNIEKAMSSRAGAKVNTLERGFNFLIALGSLAPVTGFLGTVSGMISAFRSIAKAADVNAQLVANGIFEALITTAYGLAIAILAIGGYNVLSHIVETFTTRIEESGSQIINAITLERSRKAGK
jgi:biopolymer transport protein ExbB/TolQ